MKPTVPQLIAPLEDVGVWKEQRAFQQNFQRHADALRIIEHTKRIDTHLSVGESLLHASAYAVGKTRPYQQDAA